MRARDWRQGLDRLAPDVAATVKRFPFACLLIVVATALALALANGIVRAADEEQWGRLFAGAAAGAVLATAGVLHCERGGRRRVATLLLIYGLPLLAVVLFQLQDPRWVALYMLPVPILLWLSLSPSAAVREGSAAEDVFWWSNNRALTTAVIAVAGLVLVALGLLAIDRSLLVLFSIEIGDLFYRWVLPVIAFLLVPVYWLSTLPRPEEFAPDTLAAGDFLVRAIAFIGQFVLVPFVLVYAAILHAYAVQIAMAGALPQGVLGWMVLNFLLAGMLTYILLHPRFMRDRPLVRLFRRIWFWLTLVPLGLYTLAVYSRLEAFGLTPPRVVLIAAGLWAAAISVTFLVRRGKADIRLMPALGGLFALVLAVGPLNAENIAHWQQLARLEGLLRASAGETGRSWTPEQRRAARSAFDYLYFSPTWQPDLVTLLRREGVDVEGASFDVVGIRRMLEIDGMESSGRPVTHRILSFDVAAAPIDMTETPRFQGWVRLALGPRSFAFGEHILVLEGMSLNVLGTGEEVVVSLDLSGWLDRQEEEAITDPVIRFDLEGTALALIAEAATIEIRRTEGGEAEVGILFLEGALFSD